MKKSFCNLEEILKIRTDSEFLKVFAGTPIMRTKRRGLLRNAACVAANTRAILTVDTLVDVFNQDQDSYIRGYAVYALSRLFEACNNVKRLKIKDVFSSAMKDESLFVRKEVEMALKAGRI